MALHLESGVPPRTKSAALDAALGRVIDGPQHVRDRSRLLGAASLVAFLVGWVASSAYGREPRAGGASAQLTSSVSAVRFARHGPPPRGAASSADALQTSRHLATIEHATERLQRRLDVAPGPLVPSRNPFAFPADPKARTAAPVRPTVTGPVARSSEVVLLTLSGIAEQQINGERVRTAIISTAGRLIFAKPGDQFDDRYLVIAIAADIVELRDRVDDRTLHLALP